MSRKKNVQSRRFRGVTMPTSAHPEIRKVKRAGHEPTIHGNKLWKSSCLLIDYMKKNPPEHTARVLDVGCGWGISGIWCAKKFGSQVTSVDADPKVFPYLEATAAINGVSTEHQVSRFEKLKKRQLSQFDMLIAADICFWDELVDPVTKLVDRAVKAGVKHIIIADPGRPTFTEMAERCVRKHYAEIIDYDVKKPIKATGYLMVLENA